MEPVPCFHCATVFTPRNKKQYCCIRPECQKARKANWQRIKMKTNPDYKASQKISKQKWAANHPGYWQSYRGRHPEITVRNRVLQTVRNRRRSTKQKAPDVLIAKMDARNRIKFQPIGQFWLVPLIAKMDVAKVNIYTISDTWQ
jgi:hypothetical protein